MTLGENLIGNDMQDTQSWARGILRHGRPVPVVCSQATIE